MNPSTPATPSPETPVPQPGDPISADVQQLARDAALSLGVSSDGRYYSTILSAITAARSADAQRIAELRRERDKANSERSRYRADVEMAFNKTEALNKENRTLRTELAETQSRLSFVAQERDMLADRLEGTLETSAALNELVQERKRQAAADTERLDWPDLYRLEYYHGEWHVETGCGVTGNGKTIRQAIDDARASTPPGSSVDGTTEPLGCASMRRGDVSGPINPTA